MERARNFTCGANYLAPGWFNFVCGANYPHQALKGGYTKSLMLIVGLPFTVPMEDSCLLSLLHGALTFSDYISN